MTPVEIVKWIEAVKLAQEGAKGEEWWFYNDWIWLLESELAYMAADA